MNENQSGIVRRMQGVSSAILDLRVVCMPSLLSQRLEQVTYFILCIITCKIIIVIPSHCHVLQSRRVCGLCTIALPEPDTVLDTWDMLKNSLRSEGIKNEELCEVREQYGGRVVMQ